VLADLGRPRNARIGTMDFNCFGVSGFASGSALAAAVMTLSCCAVGIATAARLDIFDIVFYLSSIGPAQADNPAHRTAIHKSHVVEDSGLRRERYHARLGVVEAIVDPNQRGVPIKFGSKNHRDTMLRLIRGVFGRIELDTHELL
jgi:hypothetical protein